MNGLQYGWNMDHTMNTRDRQMLPNQLIDTLTHFRQGGKWEVAIPNGKHEVRVSIGDAGWESRHTLNVEGVNYWNNIYLGEGEFVESTKTVTVSDGRLTLDQGSAWDKATRINYIDIDTKGHPLPFCTSPTPTPTPSPTSTRVTPTPRPTPTRVTPTPRPTPTRVTPTPRPTPTPTRVTPTPTPTRTPRPTPTPEPEPTNPGPVRNLETRINFQPEESDKVCGYFPDYGKTFKKRNNNSNRSYGWNRDHTDLARDRQIRSNQLIDTLTHFRSGGKWELRVFNGRHQITVGIGDAEYPSTHSIYVEGQRFWDGVELAANEFRQITRMIEVDDGRLTIDQGDAPEMATRMNFVTVNSSGDPECEQPAPEPRPKPKPKRKPKIDRGTTGGRGNVGRRPVGLTQLRRVFGPHCNPRTNDARTWYPSAGGRGKDGYVYYHTKLARKVGNGVVAKMRRQHRTSAADYGVWGYACRAKRGGSTWSVHSWGAAIDTNTLRNPFGASQWNGQGANGRAYGRYLPQLWMSENFYWGLHFNDPMHFQYVSGY